MPFRFIPARLDSVLFGLFVVGCGGLVAGALLTGAPSRPVPADVVVATDAETLSSVYESLNYRLDGARDGHEGVPRVFLAGLPPDLSEIQSVDRRKAMFFKSVLPLVLEVNETILSERERLLSLHRLVQAGVPLTSGDRRWLDALAARWGVGDGDLETLLLRLDIVPPSLALAQAAIESGWGTSRFAREGKSLFGQRVYRGADGMTPRAREAGEVFMVKAFGDLRDGVRAYIHNLNTHWAYREFRVERARMRARNGALDGYALAATLTRYAERGATYIRDIREIIRVNRLQSLDRARLAAGKTTRVVIPDV